MDNRSKYNNAIIRAFELTDSDDVTAVKSGETPNWDSLGHMTLISEIEDAFDIMLDPQDILAFTSYNDGICILKKYGIEA